MGNLFETALEDVGAFISRIGCELFGSGGVSTTGDLSDLRFEGMDNAQLAQVVTLLHQGPGASSTSEAADTLANIAQSLQQIDQTLRQQLQAIGVNWQSSAADLAQEMTTTASAYGGTATQAGSQAGNSMGSQGDAYSSAKHASATPADLQPFAQNKVARALTGHSTDPIAELSQGAAARDQTVDALNNYRQSSQSNLSSYQPLPAPPSVTLSTTPPAGAAGGMTTVSAFRPTGPSIGGPAPTAGASLPPNAVGGANSPTPGFPGIGPGGGPLMPNVPGSTLPTNPAPGPVTGPVTGVGSLPGPSPLNTAQAAQTAGNALSGLVEDASIGAGIAGGGVAAGIAANAGRERINRNGPSVGGAFDDEEHNPPVNRALAALDEEEAAAARAAGASGQPTLMEPAVGGGKGEDDKEHVTRYVLDSGEMFGDDRMVTPAVLGEPQPAPRPGSQPPGRDLSGELRLGSDALGAPDPNERD
jgi:hypothetical protein